MRITNNRATNVVVYDESNQRLFFFLLSLKIRGLDFLASPGCSHAESFSKNKKITELRPDDRVADQDVYTPTLLFWD